MIKTREIPEYWNETHADVFINIGQYFKKK